MPPLHHDTRHAIGDDDDDDAGNALVCCDLCPKSWHVACAGLKATPSDETWTCPACATERCGVCGKGPVPAASSILCGDGAKRGCDTVHHLACVGLAEPPEGDWLCDGCAAREAQAAEQRRPTRSRAAR